MALKNPKLISELEKAVGTDLTNADLETAADLRVMVELLKRGDYKAWQAMKSEAYGPLATKSEVEVSGEVSGIEITVKKFDKENKDGKTKGA
ncbi:hypothetical protein J6S35_00400 [Candidatus Saccharibacteria bacterium]|nr:hypothetical protein [Candidatus Saccharibacteria bacterium]